MGQEESRVVDADTSTQTLEARTIEAIAKYIRDGAAQKIVVMVSPIQARLNRQVLTLRRLAQE